MIIDKGHKMTLTTIDGRKVPVRLEVNPKARRLILRIDERQREAVAVAPSRGQLSEVAGFAADRIDWLAGRLEAIPEAHPFIDGAIIPVRGEACRLSSDGPGRIACFEQGPPTSLRAPGNPGTFAQRVTRFLKREAKSDLESSVARHCATLGVDARKISVKDTRSRWGSCTSDGCLAFSWRLVCAPPAILDYVAAHECAHLLEMNHSPAFWAEVTRCIGDWKVSRKWLRAHGPGLHALGIDAAVSSAADASAAR